MMRKIGNIFSRTQLVSKNYFYLQKCILFTVKQHSSLKINNLAKLAK